MRDYKIYLKDILAAMESIEAFVKGMSFKEFLTDDKTTSTVIRKFEITGEATKQISDDTGQQYPDVPWKDMAGILDRLIHFYLGVDYQLVWTAIKQRLPRLKEEMQKVQGIWRNKVPRDRASC